MVELNKIQVTVMRELWFHTSRRFSEMMAVTELTSDDFKFHLRKLVKLGLVEKNEDHAYRLTIRGKEFANRFEYENGAPIYQPKMTTATYVRRINQVSGEVEYLFHQRLRQPFYHYWGVIGRPVRLGETFEEAAKQGLEEQIGLTTPLVLKGFYRQRDVAVESGEVLEDKLFVVYQAEWKGQELIHWPHANAKWMTLSDFETTAKRFDSCVDMLKRLREDMLWYADNTSKYSDSDF